MSSFRLFLQAAEHCLECFRSNDSEVAATYKHVVGEILAEIERGIKEDYSLDLVLPGSVQEACACLDLYSNECFFLCARLRPRLEEVLRREVIDPLRKKQKRLDDQDGAESQKVSKKDKVVRIY